MQAGVVFTAYNSADGGLEFVYSSNIFTAESMSPQ